MKRTSSTFPEPPAPSAPARYNVELPGLQTYVSGLVTNSGRACVHVRMGEFSHVVWAEGAIEIAKAITQQAESAIGFANAIRELHKKADEMVSEEKEPA